MSGNDHTLIQGLAEGRESSYKILFDEYYLVLTVYARKYLGDMDEAREIVQDVFVRIYESRQLLARVDSLKAYLFTSVRNSCYNYIKSNKTHQKHQEKIRLEQSGKKEDVMEQIQESELEQHIFRIVSGLPDRCREIFRMSRVEGLKNDEIARECNISKRTVETQISKALKVLRLELAPYLSLFFFILLYVFM